MEPTNRAASERQAGELRVRSFELKVSLRVRALFVCLSLSLAHFLPLVSLSICNLQSTVSTVFLPARQAAERIVLLTQHPKRNQLVRLVIQSHQRAGHTKALNGEQSEVVVFVVAVSCRVGVSGQLEREQNC